jgi:hypothetical protein
VQLRTLRIGTVAGLVAAMTSNAWLFATTLAAGSGSMGSLYAHMARVAYGAAPITGNPVAIGLLLYCGASLGWAYGYAGLASRNPALARAPWISGSVFGVLVLIAMQSMLLSVHQFHPFSPLGFLNLVILYTAFFGVPLALTVARLQKRAG